MIVEMDPAGSELTELTLSFLRFKMKCFIFQFSCFLPHFRFVNYLSGKHLGLSKSTIQLLAEDFS